MAVNLRPIAPGDNARLATIIRTSLEEFDVPKEGSVYSDYHTDYLFELFNDNPGSCYFVAEENDELIGGCGIFPTPGLLAGYAELVKLYLTDATRGRGIGKMLVQQCFDEAIATGYTHLYLESFPQLAKAVSMYNSLGFEPLTHALGDSGHFACTIWMVKKL